MYINNLITIGRLDLDLIESHHAVVRDVIDYSNLKEIPIGQIDANSILWEIFSCINNEVFSYLKNQIKNGELTLSKRKKSSLLKLCEKRIDEFFPFLNCLDSWFRNELDDVRVADREIKDIAQEVLPLLIANS